MPAGLHNMAKMTVSGTPGTGTITLGAAVAQCQTFAAAGVQDQETVSYTAVDANLRENGRGLYSASGATLTRSPLPAGTSPVNLSSNAIVWIDNLAEDLQALTLYQHANCGGF